MGGHETIAPKTAPTEPRAPDHLIETVLGGRYLVERKLGQGGFGIVYLASDIKVVSRKIVVKVMNNKELTSDWRKKKFRQEFEALARIDHPGVVGVLDSGETPDGSPYIVMQYIDGVSLRSLLTAQGMSFGRVAHLVRQIGKALSAAHEAGILHRDLKPENIMVQTTDDEEYVKVIDFGVAKVRNSMIDVSTTKDIAVGTIAYMSPEQLSAQPLTTASDVYALGVITYEMLTGKRPTNPESAFQLLEMQRAGVRVNPADLRPGLPPQAENVILKALSFNPHERYERARDFCDSLAVALLGDEKQTVIDTRKQDVDIQPSTTPSLETAHVLFVDIVGYSRLVMDEQARQLQKLQQFVSDTSECRRAKELNKLIALPTGDGMALVFFEDPEAPVRCAVELSRKLKATPEIQLRMGVHSGLVYRMADIKNNMNVAGGGINTAQRVMDCGEGGHILLSNRVADDLGQLARWSEYLHDLGTAEVKHNLVVHVFNLYGDDFGNPEIPLKLRKTEKRRLLKNLPIIVAPIAALVVIATIFLYWYRLQPASSPPSNSNVIAKDPITTGPERSLTYWLSYMKMRNGKPDSEIRQSAGNDIFGNGWRFQFNVTPKESGALYLLNVGPGKNNAEEYNILFPLPGVTQSDPNLQANQPFKSDWARFVDRKGVERIWIIWSAQRIADLDEIFKRAASNEGVIANSDEIAKVRAYLNSANSAAIHDKEKKQTVVKGTGDILVNLVELTHEAN